MRLSHKKLMMFVEAIFLMVLSLCTFCKAYEPCSFYDVTTAYSFDKTYYSPGYYKSSGYDPNVMCKIHFQALYEHDKVTVEVTNMDMKERSSTYGCRDRLTFHDGNSVTGDILEVLCGTEKAVVESTGQDLVAVFITDDHQDKVHKGFSIRYKSIGEGADGYKPSSSSGLSAGEIVAMCIPGVILYIIVGFVIYKRCKYYRQIQNNLAATGHTPEDLRMAMVTMMEQARRGPLNAQQGGDANPQVARKPPSRREVRLAVANMMNQAGQGPIPPGQDALQECLRQHMNQSAAQRIGAEANRKGKKSRHSQGRVRHPAGDINAEQVQHGYHPYPPNSQLQDSSTVPFLSEDGGGAGYHPHNQHHPQYPYPPTDLNGASNNNVMVNNNTAANLNYQTNNGGGYPSPYSMSNADQSGIYYAGDVDEYGNLHPPQASTNFSPYGPPPPPPSSNASLSHHGPAAVYLNSRPLLDEDRMSEGSGTHRGGSGRNSPRDPHHHSSGHRSRASSAGRRSPHQNHSPHHHHYQQQPHTQQLGGGNSGGDGGGSSQPNVLTYYGMIDGQGGGEHATEASGPTTDSIGHDALGAPPSYEEVTGSGRLTPHNVQ